MSGRGGFFATYEGTEVREAVAAELREAVARYADGVVPVKGQLLVGAPAKQLIAESLDLDLLVMGSRGFGGLRRALLGSVSGQVVLDAACPVLVVPRGVHVLVADEAKLAGTVQG